MSSFDHNSVSKQLAQVRIVRVNTTLPANIGSALRAMKTMGLIKLVLLLHLKHILTQTYKRLLLVRRIYLNILRLSTS